MAKSSGLGQLFVYGGYDLSGDTGELGSVHGGPSPLEVTGIDKNAIVRIGGLLDGGIDFMAFFNDAAGQAHPVLSAITAADRQAIYAHASTLGAAAAGIVAKQIDYAGTRDPDGALTYQIENPGNGSSLEWGNLLTAGLRIDTVATNGAGVDGLAASTTGWSAYLQVIDVTGTNVIVTLEDSADNISFAAFTSSAFTSATVDRTVQRIAGAAGSTVRRYVRAVSSGVFSSATFIALLCRRPVGS